MIGYSDTQSIAFAGSSQVAAGMLPLVVAAVKELLESDPEKSVLIFDDVTSHPIEVDLRGTRDEVLARIHSTPSATSASPTDQVAVAQEAESPRGPGRPRLGVVAREVTLLPRHWEWLAKQQGGASVALRKLVDEAKKANESRDRARAAQESAYRFMSTMAGNQPQFEEATRAFFANNAERFEELTVAWPKDVREHALVLASRAFGASRFRLV